MGILADALIAKGYNPTDALNAENGPRAAELAREYLGGSSSGGSSGGGTTLPPFKFDQAAADKAAMEELRPYYEKLLKIYNGDVQLAKQRMEQDYERGLRYKKEETANAMGDIETAQRERDRKFKIALGDLDQEMNSRGIYTSGIRTQKTGEATADEAYQKKLLSDKARDLALTEKKYIEEQDVTKNRFLEDKGFKQTGVEGFMSEPEKYKWEQSKKMSEQAADMALMKRNQAFQDWQAGVTPVASATPSNYTKMLNDALKLSGLPAVG